MNKETFTDQELLMMSYQLVIDLNPSQKSIVNNFYVNWPTWARNDVDKIYVAFKKVAGREITESQIRYRNW